MCANSECQRRLGPRVCAAAVELIGCGHGPNSFANRSTRPRSFWMGISWNGVARMPGLKPPHIDLTSDELAELENLVRAQNIAQAPARRARVVLLATTGYSNIDIARWCHWTTRQLGCSREAGSRYAGPAGGGERAETPRRCTTASWSTALDRRAGTPHRGIGLCTAQRLRSTNQQVEPLRLGRRNHQGGLRSGSHRAIPSAERLLNALRRANAR